MFGLVWQSNLTCARRENFLVLDIFFEALNYETIEQKKAYDVAGLLGMIYVTISSLFCFNLNHTASSLKGFQQTHISVQRRPLTGAAFPVLRWHRGTDGLVHWSQHPDSVGNPGLYLWGTAVHTPGTRTLSDQFKFCNNEIDCNKKNPNISKKPPAPLVFILQCADRVYLVKW